MFLDGNIVIENAGYQVRAVHAGGSGILLPNNQRQQRTLHIQEDVLPHAFC